MMQAKRQHRALLIHCQYVQIELWIMIVGDREGLWNYGLVSPKSHSYYFSFSKKDFISFYLRVSE